MERLSHPGGKRGRPCALPSNSSEKEIAVTLSSEKETTCKASTSNPTPSSSTACDFAAANSVSATTETPHSIIKDIFPYLSDLEILEALKKYGDVETAVNKLSEKALGSADQIDFYASIFGRDDDDSDEFTESAWKVTSDEVSNAGKNQEDKVPFPDKLKDLHKKCIDSDSEIKLKVRRS